MFFGLTENNPNKRVCHEDMVKMLNENVTNSEIAKRAP